MKEFSSNIDESLEMKADHFHWLLSQYAAESDSMILFMEPTWGSV
jgi:hypothetical protein